MKKKISFILLAGALIAALFTGCSGSGSAAGAATGAVEQEQTEDTAGTVTDTADAAGSAEAESSTPELTFEDLQNNYQKLVESYDQVEALYMTDQVAQNDKIEELLGEAKSIIEEMGEATREDFSSQQDYITMNNNMATLIDSLIEIVAGMKTAKPDSSNGDDVKNRLGDILTVGYSGTSEGGEELYLATDKKVDSGILGIVDNGEAIFLTGDITEENGELTIVDNESGDSLTFQIEEGTDEEGKAVLFLTVAANGAKGTLYPADASEVLKAMDKY